jgi:hypothetical protein
VQIPRDRFPPGEAVGWSRPGDFLLVSGTSWRSMIVARCERSRARGADERRCAYWTHAALVVGVDGVIVEAGTAGVVLQHLDKYREEDYHYVAVRATPEERWHAVRFALSRVGSRYSNLALGSLAVSALTRGRARLPESRYELCGSLVARALACAGERFAIPPGEMLPADLAFHYGVFPDTGRSGRERAPFAGSAQQAARAAPHQQRGRAEREPDQQKAERDPG